MLKGSEIEQINYKPTTSIRTSLGFIYAIEDQNQHIETIF
jgi:hypothetical protein